MVRDYLKLLVLVLGFTTVPMLLPQQRFRCSQLPRFFHHWDHHWYIWLPGDPVFEAVEIMAAERGPNTNPLVWIFFHRARRAEASDPLLQRRPDRRRRRRAIARHGPHDVRGRRGTAGRFRCL